MEGNIEGIEDENEKLKQFIAERENDQEVTADNIDSLVYPSNEVSQKLIHLQSKIAAIDDAMSIVKKAFDKDNLNLQEFLKLIRQLSSKQARQISKIRRLVCATSQMGGA